jgi:thiamine transport system ATP-binding protein
MRPSAGAGASRASAASDGGLDLMLEILGATVKYGAVTAVSDVTMTVPDGTVLALLGPSGCGKSTLLRAVAGLEPVASGEIRWDATDLTSVPIHRRAFGLMFQDGVLFPHRDVAGNIGYGLRRAGLRGPAVERRVQELLDLVGLPGYGARRVTTLSGGQAQRVALARALAPRPRLLLLDEPLAALDRSLRERLLVDLRAVLTATATTAIFVTHDQGEAFAVADRLAVLRAGSVQQIGTAREIWTHPADDWVAGFVGYSSVLDAAAAARLGAADPGGGRRLGLRPAALVVDAAGAVAGAVEVVSPSPDGLLLSVLIDGVGAVQAVGPADARTPVQAGDRVRLRLDPAATASIPAAGRPAKNSD